MAAALHFLARQISPPVLADGELLDRFAQNRDNEAFAELVRRHGPVVYRICRRLVGTTAADDAFQATFLLLATRTSAAKCSHSIGGWLVGVAGRVARQIRRASLRRQSREAKAASRLLVESSDTAPELLDQFRILDEELARLPDHLRNPLVSCLLQGHAQEVVAARSGQTARTIRRRLHEAKRLLRIRLLRRGVTPAVAVGLVAGLASVATAIPVGLGTRTVAVVFDFLTGGPALVSPPVILAKEVATNMLARKVMASIVAISLGLTSLGFVLAQDPKPSPNPTTAKAAGSQPFPVQPTPLPPGSVAPPPLVIREKDLPKSPSEDVKRQIDQLAQKIKPGEQQFLIETMCVKVPVGFWEESGLLAEKPKPGYQPLMVACLNHREVKMLDALFRAKKPDLEILGRPTLVVFEGKAGSVKAGETIEVGIYEVTDNSGGKADSPKLTKTSSHIYSNYSLHLTPSIDKDDGLIYIKIDSLTAQPGDPIKTLNSLVKPSINVAPSNATVAISSAGTAVFGGTLESAKDKTKKTEWLWVLTAHSIKGKQ
jgi:RNA polymerase sigma factor (sigma-70 family)